MEPIRFVEETATPSGPTPDSTQVVDRQFFERVLEGSSKTLREGDILDLRIASPHVNCVLRSLYVGAVLSAETALQLRIPNAISAPEGHQLLAFTLQGELPLYDRTAERYESASIRVAGRPIALTDLFDSYVRGQGWLREWEMVAMVVPDDAEVVLAIEDQGNTVTVDLRTGQPVEDDAWAANQGFRERRSMALDPQVGLFQAAFETRPPEGYDPDPGGLILQLQPDVAYATIPWIPTLQWAEPGKQWLLVPMLTRVSYDNLPPQMEIDVAASFLYRDQAGTEILAVSPETLTFEQLLRGQADLALVWPVSGADDQGTIVVDLKGPLTVDYSDAPSIPAELTETPTPVEFRCSFSDPTEP